MKRFARNLAWAFGSSLIVATVLALWAESFDGFFIALGILSVSGFAVIAVVDGIEAIDSALMRRQERRTRARIADILARAEERSNGTRL